MMKMQKILSLFLLLSCIHCYTQELFAPLPPLEQFIAQKVWEVRASYITFLTANNGERYLVKQKKLTYLHDRDISDYKVDMLWRGVREVMAAFVAQRMGIRSHAVWVLPAKTRYFGKYLVDYPATLHTFVSGKPVKDTSSLYHGTSIHLKKNKENLKQNKISFCYEVITNMARHEQLPVIVALDTFVGNTSRHTNNLLYDEMTDTFGVIDMETTFVFSHVDRAIENLQSMMHNSRIRFSPAEIRALKSYRKALQSIIDRISLDELEQALAETVAHAQFSYSTAARDVQQCKQFIQHNYQQLPKLIALLDDVIEHYHRKSLLFVWN